MSKRYPGGILRKTPQTPSQTSAQGVWDMASVTQAVKENTWPIAGVPDPISKSLRFRSSASAYLNRTFSPPTNNKIWTWSGWVKRGTLGTSQGIIGTTDNNLSSGNFGTVRFTPNNFLEYFEYSSGYTLQLSSSSVYRDPSAWYHIVFAVDTTQVTSSNRVKLYVNGVQITAFGTATYPAQNYNTYINSAITTYQGSYNNSTTGIQAPFDGYMTEVYLIDGQQLTPSSFGGTNDQTGVWQPIAYTGTYGTNGFYLPFSNTASTSTLGYDFSGNSNNWTTNNISLTSGTTYDSMVDVPTQWIPYNTAGDTGALFRGNYCVLNPLAVANSQPTFSNANLQISAPSAWSGFIGTLGVSSGKWYWEAVNGNSDAYVGICGSNLPFGQVNPQAESGNIVYYGGTGEKRVDGAMTSYGASYSTETIGVALDIDGGTVTFYRNNTSQGSISLSSSTLNGKTIFPFFVKYASTATVNFGQRPFSYTPPTGFKTLCTTNLPTPTIGATASSQANRYMDVLTWTGDGASSRAITGLNFQPDWVWDKMRSGAYQHAIVDSVRGGNQVLHSNSTSAEDTNWQYGYVSSFNSNGFTIQAGATSSENWNLNGSTFVAWTWKANGSGSTNTAGSITSTVSANTTAGFSIVTFTMPSSGVSTIGHGLGVAPSMVILKSRANSSGWVVYHTSTGAGGYTLLNTTAAYGADSNAFNNTAPTSSVFTVGTSFNGLSGTYLAYCFSAVAGYSAFGSYTGNGSTDGPFVYTGFRPAYLMVKRTNAAVNWYVFDSKRNTYNAVNLQLSPNLSNAEASDFVLDFLSNGFKFRIADSFVNGSGDPYIYAAFAESPFKYALAR